MNILEDYIRVSNITQGRKEDMKSRKIQSKVRNASCKDDFDHGILWT